jgi:hypothetical protein
VHHGLSSPPGLVNDFIIIETFVSLVTLCVGWVQEHSDQLDCCGTCVVGYVLYSYFDRMAIGIVVSW